MLLKHLAKALLRGFPLQGHLALSPQFDLTKVLAVVAHLSYVQLPLCLLTLLHGLLQPLALLLGSLLPLVFIYLFLGIKLHRCLLLFLDPLSQL